MTYFETISVLFFLVALAGFLFRVRQELQAPTKPPRIRTTPGHDPRRGK